MRREIVKDELFLRQKAEPAGESDLWIAQDLKDTLDANRSICAGMAANMIGFARAIIIVAIGDFDLVMINPKIVRKSGPYTAKEGCLSLAGMRSTKRWQKITVRYQDLSLQWHTEDFSSMPAEVIQHECDHLQGILI